jgi:predicted AAA+ superfamily ATPase
MTGIIFKRLLTVPNSTFFLLGPRGTGKSTWLVQELTDAHRIDLLRSSEFLRLQKDPSLLRSEVLALPAGSWVIIDEIQKLPVLLDEVHALIFDTAHGYKFALSGSSARKLKKEHANLLAGRALSKKFFPLSVLELKDQFDLTRALSFGQLPPIWTSGSNKDRIDYLDAYVETYLKEEIQQEALVRALSSFHRFLGVAALCNAQILNMSNVARDVGVARSTVQGYFEIILDTLVGWMLPPFRPRAKVKELAHPKFYFFDCGVVRALRNETRFELPASVVGHLFETFFINEVKALNSYFSLGAELFYWQAEHGTEVDLVVGVGTHRIGFEVKNITTWHRSYNKGLISLKEAGVIKKGFGIYVGEKKLLMDTIEVLPYKYALSNLELLLS